MHIFQNNRMIMIAIRKDEETADIGRMDVCVKIYTLIIYMMNIDMKEYICIHT